MAGEIGALLQNTRGFLASQLGRFDEIGQKRGEEHRDRGQLGDYIGQTFDPLARLGQIGMGLPGGTSWGGVARANPTADWLLGHGSPYRNPFAPKDDPLKQPGGEGAFNPQQGPATPGANFGNPTGRDVEALLAGTPLQGYGGRIGQLAQQYGVPVALVMGILNAESSFTTSAGGAANNFGGLKNADGSGTFASFPTVDQGLEAVIRNMGSSIYQGLSLGDYLNKYLGGPQGGDPAQYYSNVTTVIKRLGGNPDFASVPVGPPQRQATGGAPYQGTGGMSSIWGGGNGPITQQYGAVTPGIDQGIYGYGAAYGLAQGHTGDDIGLARGTKLYMPAGLTGVVTTAGGTPYFRDEDYGDRGTPGKGELRITLSNGDILILGHTSQINVGVGQQLKGGDFVGLSGSANGDHLHLEVRRRNADGSYSLIDPAVYFGQASGGGGGNR